MKRALCIAALSVAVVAGSATSAAASTTTVPGQVGRSGVVTGTYTSVYAYDDSGAYYWDLGDGRVRMSSGVTSIEDLDQATLTVCDYRNIYRGDFGTDPSLDNGWVRNNIRCHGYDGNATFNGAYVHASDPRYSGEGESIWTTWEVFVDTASGEGNLASPAHAND